MQQEIIEEFKNKAQNSTALLKRELQLVRTNRPTPALVEDLKIDYYGQKLSLKQVGSTSIELPYDILIQVWDKEAVSHVVKAIEASDLGLSVSVQGNIVRARLPELSEERREELRRHIGKVVENYRIQIRHFRDEANKKIENAARQSVLDEDQKFKLKEKIQEETDKINEEIEALLANKIKEMGGRMSQN